MSITISVNNMLRQHLEGGLTYKFNSCLHITSDSKLRRSVGE